MTMVDIAVILAAAAFAVLVGFLVPVLAALIIGFASWPLYRHVIALAQGNRTLSASIMIAAIVLFLVVPALFIGSYAVQEIRMLFQWGVATNSQGAPAPEWFATLPLGADWLTGIWDERIGRPGVKNAHARPGRRP